MTTRPYARERVEALQAIAETAEKANDRSTLEALMAELGHRSRPRAKALLAYLEALPATPEAPPPPPSGGTVVVPFPGHEAPSKPAKPKPKPAKGGAKARIRELWENPESKQARTEAFQALTSAEQKALEAVGFCPVFRPFRHWARMPGMSMVVSRMDGLAARITLSGKPYWAEREIVVPALRYWPDGRLPLGLVEVALEVAEAA